MARRAAPPAPQDWGVNDGTRASSHPRVGGPGGPKPGRPNVVLFAGHLPDGPDRPQPRFPGGLEAAARRRLGEVLDRWRIGSGDLGICGAARGGDMLFAELCVARGAGVRLCVALPQERFLQTSVRAEDTDWESRYFALIANPLVTTEFATWPAEGDPDEAYRATNVRMIDLARALAGSDGFRVLVLWDELHEHDNPGSTSSFVRLVDGLAREFAIVNPRRL